MKLHLALSLAAVVSLAQGAAAQTERIITGLTAPIFAASLPDDPRIFVVERAGVIRIWDGDELLDPPFLDIEEPVNDGGEGGLLSLAFAPDFAISRAFYVYYTVTGTSGGPLESRISRFLVREDNPNRADQGPDKEKVLLRVEQPEVTHNGGTIAFGADDYLYMAFGDGGGANDPLDNAQDPTTLLGKMIRIDVDFTNLTDDYQIPATNPFVGGGDGIRDEIWAMGFRNPFRFSFDRTEGDLYVGDVGQGAFEEVDVEPAGDAGGRNYGWDVLEALQCNDPGPRSEPPCDFSGFTDPIYAYARFGGCNSITGGIVYRGAQPSAQGRYYFADYCVDRIWSLVWDGAGGVVGDVVEETTALAPDAGTIGSIVAFGEDGAGELLIVDAGGEVFRMVPEPGGPLLLLAGAGVLAASRGAGRRRR